MYIINNTTCEETNKGTEGIVNLPELQTVDSYIRYTRKGIAQMHAAKRTTWQNLSTYVYIW